ncbi:MAG TPA: ASCH domain-containing protein [Candidatus Tetragenococcus pullicola]|nr:ASCH domain-containing protein [Candidatus Tetragenococcus pullicola]
MTEEKIKSYWQQFKQEENSMVENYSAWSYGDSPEMADELALLTVQKIKTATTSALELYEEDEPVPQVGEYNIILNGSGLPVCITKTKKVEVVAFDQVSKEHAYNEGEGDRSLTDWRKVHQDFFEKEYAQQNKTFSTDSACLCETFEVVFI